jgi:membrane protease YdiL (CAAX protease family)
MMNTLAAWLTLLAYLAFAYRPWRGILARLNNWLGEWAVALFMLPYLLAVGFQPRLSDLVRLVACLVVPTLCLRLRRRDARPFDLFHILTILAIWVPVEPHLFVLILDLVTPGIDLGRFSTRSLWPQAEALLIPGVQLPIHTLTAVLLACYLFLVYRPLKEIGFSWRLRRRDVVAALLGLLAFSIAGLPSGLWTGFLRFNLRLPDLLTLVTGIVGGYLLVALPEELLFRGIIQNLLSGRSRRGWLVLPFAAAIFGVAHLNNSTPSFPVPNWTYVLMAYLDGMSYGWVWMRTKKVTASAITHMLVNLIWGIAFH